jgi:Spherulation-specific family 4
MLPDSNWIREITKLNSYKNVQSIGYIAVTYGKRPLGTVTEDINHYAQWASGDPGLVMQGIFIDEVPSIANEHNVDYVRAVEQAIRKIPLLAHSNIGRFR